MAFISCNLRGGGKISRKNHNQWNYEYILGLDFKFGIRS